MSSTAYALPAPDLVLDRYRPLRPLGRGGSGSVWLARDERTGLEVALKIVPREGKRASRAAREMEAASRLRHERCVRAYDVGGDSGHVYIAYEYVPGSTLREALRAGELGDRDAVEAAAQILDALAHAHRIGIVHRDVKPSNVLVEESARDLGPAARLRPRPVRRGRHADRRRRRARHARLHRARAPRAAATRRPRATSGRSASCSGRRSPASIRSGASRCPRWRAAIEAGAPPLGTARRRPAAGDRRRRLVGARDRAGATPVRASVSPPICGAALALAPPRSDEAARAAQRPRPSPRPESLRPRCPLERRLVPAALAAVAAAFARDVAAVLAARPRAAARPRSGRWRCSARRGSGSRSRSSCPSSRSGTSPRPAAVDVRGARRRLARASAGATPAPACCSSPGPLLAAVGALALLPLAVQPARGRGAARAAGVRRRPRGRCSRGPARAAAPAHRDGRAQPRRRRLDPRHRRRPGARRRSSRPTPASSPSPLVLALASAAAAGRAQARAEGHRACSERGQVAARPRARPGAARAAASCSAHAALCAVLALLTLQTGRYP